MTLQIYIIFSNSSRAVDLVLIELHNTVKSFKIPYREVSIIYRNISSNTISISQAQTLKTLPSQRYFKTPSLHTSMAPKSAPRPFVLPENTNFLAIASDAEANPIYKCCTKFISESYLKEALFARPTLYLDILEEFWGSVTMGEVALKSGEIKQVITCTIKTINISFTEDDLNKTFQLPEVNLHAPATDEELVDFMDFIHILLKLT